MGAVHPGLEVGDRAVHSWQQLLAVGDGGDLARTVVIAERGQPVIGEQAVGVHDRAFGGRRGRERLERRRLGVGQHLQAQAPRAAAANLDRSADEQLLSVLAPAFEALLVAAEKELVDLDLALEQLALGRDHRRAKLVQHRPRGLVTADPELALKLLGADPRMKRRDQIGRPEPRPQVQPGLMHDRPSGNRRLPPARGADPQMPTRLAPGVTPTAARTDKALRPKTGTRGTPPRPRTAARTPKSSTDS